MKQVLMIGASGMIGSLILNHCLQSPEVKKVTSIVRKASTIRHSKLTEIIHTNFHDFSAIAEAFAGQDLAFYCIGVYTGAVDEEMFKKITVDYTCAFADMLAARSPAVTLCFLSGQGADREEKSRVSFARYKGMAENYIFEKKFAHCYSFRPSYIFPVQARREPNFFYRLMRSLYPLIRLLGKNFSVKSTELAKVMFEVGAHQHQKAILENRDIRTLINEEN